MDRRQFLSLTALAVAGLLPLQTMPARARGKRSLVVLTLSGGNDGLNTVIPASTGAYYDLRPKIAVKQGDVLLLKDGFGFHPSLRDLHSMYNDGRVAVIQGVGYEKPNRSHFRSIEIWQTAQPDIIGSTGWLGRYLDTIERSEAKDSTMLAVNIDPVLPKSLLAKNVTVPSVYDLDQFTFKVSPPYSGDRDAQLAAFNDIYKGLEHNRPHLARIKETGLEANAASEKLHALAARPGGVKYPDGRLSQSLALVARMIEGNVGARVYTLSLDGFDTHANQMSAHPALLANLSRSLSAFTRDLAARGLDDDVTVLVFSEFGRRAGENGARGTDHGTAGPCLVLGKNVKGGLYGEAPSLTSLDNGDLKYTTDFRSVYATILDRWFGVEHREIVGKRFETLDFV